MNPPWSLELQSSLRRSVIQLICDCYELLNVHFRGYHNSGDGWTNNSRTTIQQPTISGMVHQWERKRQLYVQSMRIEILSELTSFTVDAINCPTSSTWFSSDGYAACCPAGNSCSRIWTSCSGNIALGMPSASWYALSCRY